MLKSFCKIHFLKFLFLSLFDINIVTGSRSVSSTQKIWDEVLYQNSLTSFSCQLLSLKGSILDIWLGSECSSGNWRNEVLSTITFSFTAELQYFISIIITAKDKIKISIFFHTKRLFNFSYFFYIEKQPLEVFYKKRCSLRKDAFKSFAKFTGKHLCQSLFFNKVAGLSQLY